MIFQHTWQQVLDGTKTQTRRIVKEKEWYSCQFTHPLLGCGWHLVPAFEYQKTKHIHAILSQYGHTRLKKGNRYAVQQGRGKPSVGRIKINAIRREHVQDITEQDAEAEGITWYDAYIDGYPSAIDAYRALWDSIHTKTGETWADNPLVWVLEFELVKGRE